MSLNPKIRDWQGRRVWLMGASSGLGAALAEALAAAGAQVAVSGRRAAALADVLARMPGQGHLALACDATDPSALAEAKQHLLLAWGGLDIAVYLAGDYQAQSADDFSLATVRQLCEVNYLSAAAFAECVLPLWLHQSSAGVRGLVFVGSVAGYRGLPKALAYGPPKAALIHFAETLYLDLHASNIGVWLINPGFFATRLTAKNNFHMPALLSVEAAAKALLAGLASGNFETHFPRRFTCLLRLLRLLPDGLYFRLIKKITGA